MNWTWELYQDADGEIPKDLLAFFVALIPEQERSPDLPQNVLTSSESRRLQVNLERLCKKGLAALDGDVFEKLETDLYALCLTKSEHNPRFLITTATPKRFIVLHAFLKKYDGAVRDRDKEPARQRLRRLREQR